MRAKRTTIRIRGYIRDKDVSALVLAPRVAVHRAYHDDGFTVSDPRTGFSYWERRGVSERKALSVARAMMREFGDDPLRGSIHTGGIWGNGWKRKPRRAAELRKFLEGR